MATLDKLLGIGSFNSMVGNLAYCQVILLVFSRGLGFHLVVQLVAPTFLRFWVMIIPTLVIRF